MHRRRQRSFLVAGRTKTDILQRSTRGISSSDPIVTSINVIALSAKAPHPNAAKLFVNYVLSEEGQNIIRDASRVPVRPGVKPLAPKLDQSAVKIHYVLADMFKKIAEYEKEFRDIFWKK